MILVVDDDQQVRSTIVRGLTALGYAVREAAGGADALALIGEQKPQLIVLDYMMPGMNGLELCEQIRLHPTAGKMPVLMLSAVDSEEFIRLSVIAGANGHIPKSEMHRRLLHEVNQYLPAIQSK